jgi:uncharacterized protein (DUF433 family)
MELRFIQKQYYQTIENSLDSEFMKKQSRPYFYLSGVKYKGQNISVAIPLRANINLKTVNYSDIIPIPSSNHTQANKISGWQLNKAIPFFPKLFNVTHTNPNDLVIAEKGAKANISVMRIRMQTILNKWAAGEKIFGSIDFDNALKVMSRLNKSVAGKAINTVKTSLQSGAAELSADDKELLKKYPIDKKKLEQAKRVQEKYLDPGVPLEHTIRRNIMFALNVYGEELSEKIREEENAKKQIAGQRNQTKTQEKIEPKTVAPKSKTDTKKSSPKGK